MSEFVHLHCHTQYSLLDGASEIGQMMDKAVKDGMKGLAMTDHGNMFGAFKFVNEANKRNLKPIVGCEFYLVEDRHKKNFNRAAGEKDNRFHQLLLAKNSVGYQNLSKLCSLGFIEGNYSKFPRIDKELLLKYHEGLIASSCCIGAMIPQLIIAGKIEEAEKELKWWIDLFGEDFYIEIQRHRGLDDIDFTDEFGKKRLSGKSQEDINQTLLSFAAKYQLKVIATNDSHYVEEDDYLAHDMLLCINTGTIIEDENRFKFSSSDYFFKSQNEMTKLFKDVPQAIDNTMEVFDKIEKLQLKRDVLLPAFPLPNGFSSQDEYLKHLTYVGAQKRYGDITPAIKDRIDFELDVIRKSGYPGYFLIVQDFTSKAREMGVSVGPGRGSAAGSAVAYCVGITNVDPIKYDLLFERFLNPERVSMPDIDIDFDDEGRQKVIDYVIESYGKEQVAQIITYGSMAARSSLKDVGRVMNIPLNEVTAVTKKFPDDLSATLSKVLEAGDINPKLKEKMNSEDKEKAYAFRSLAERDDDIGQMIRSAKKLEGSVRNTGIHACGIIITPEPLTNVVPITTDKDNIMYVTQYDNSVAEDAGLLKMDFLGLRTLSILKEAVRLIKETHNITIDLDDLPLDDDLTYELFQKGNTIAIFQYESAGMQKHLRDLKPTKFEDLIAMNALYRPGPLQYIPSFCKRKNGTEEIIYDLQECEEYLAETYGITVYQEQVMLLSQKLAGFSKGQADKLRKGMGKKQKEVIDELWPKFLEGCLAKGFPEPTVKKIWTDWEAFASYAFNKSHSTCYALIAYQTGYLKANYPAEFMAAVLSNNMNDISKVEFFLSECKSQNIDVLGPSVNESAMKFSVNKKGQIRFGLAAIKGVGGGPVDEILSQRKSGEYLSFFDFIKRVSQRVVNKKALESLALAGAFDEFEGAHRARFFAPSDKYDSLIEHAIRFGNSYQSLQEQSTNSLFGDMGTVGIEEPVMPDCEEWPIFEQLKKEKEVVGMYISAHPLDQFKLVMKFCSNVTLDDLAELENVDPRHRNKKLNFGCIITKVQHRITKTGTGWGEIEIQDYNGSMTLRLFKDDYLKYKPFMNVGQIVFVSGALVKRKSWNSDQEETVLSIADMKLMDGLSKTMIDNITLQFSVHSLDQDMLLSLTNILVDNKGDHRMYFEIVDPIEETVLKLNFPTKVEVNEELTQILDELNIKYLIR